MTEEDTNELIRYETVTSPGLRTYSEIHFAQGFDAGQTELREVMKHLSGESDARLLR
jgi:hypothetical protein